MVESFKTLNCIGILHGLISRDLLISKIICHHLICNTFLERFKNTSILLCMNIILTSIVHPKLNMNCSQIIVGMKLNVGLHFMV
jgi:hypothetical protein